MPDYLHARAHFTERYIHIEIQLYTQSNYYTPLKSLAPPVNTWESIINRRLGIE